MPFTFSHAAAALPFFNIRQSWVSASALVIGSVTPDFEYFIKMKLAGRYSHSLEGMFLLDLPIACAIALIFHCLVKKPLVNNFPDYFHGRLIDLRDFDFISYLRGHWVGFICCLLIGIGSHIIWDGFTHANAFEKSLPFLRTPVSIGEIQLPLFRVLQHLSSVIGGCFIILIFHRRRVRFGENHPSFKFWIISLVVAGFASAVRAFFGFEYIGDIVTTVISAGMLGVIATSLFGYLRWVKV